MKKKFNVYCVLMLLFIAGELAFNFVTDINDFVTGFKDGWNSVPSSDADSPDDSRVVTFAFLRALDHDRYDYSVFNKKTGRKEPMQLLVVKLSTVSTERSSVVLQLVGGLSILLFVVTLVMFWVHFIKLILAVNRGVAFDRVIERRLRIIGRLLLLMYVAEWGIDLFVYYTNRGMIDVPGYEVVMDDHPSLILLLSGLGMLIVAQIFTIGRQLKEEQELTI